jgi:hypothetical protein
MEAISQCFLDKLDGRSLIEMFELLAAGTGIQDVVGQMIPAPRY